MAISDLTAIETLNSLIKLSNQMLKVLHLRAILENTSFFISIKEQIIFGFTEFYFFCYKYL